MQKIISLVLVSLALVACQKNSPAPQADSETEVPVSTAPAESTVPNPKKELAIASEGPLTLVAEPVGLAEANRYQVKLTWTRPAELSNTGWRIERQDLEENRVVGPDKTEYIDSQVVAGQTYQYRVNLMGAGITDQVKVTVPKDLEISDTQVLTEPVTSLIFNRILFNGAGVLLTQGNELRISARELISQGGTIRTFSDDQLTAPLGDAGKNGGKISIRVWRAAGELRIIGDGQNGAIGADAQAKNNLQGREGERGSKGVMEWLPGAMKGTDDGRVLDQPQLRSGLVCTTAPGNGGDGYPGLTGDNGGDGRNGGNSAQIFFLAQKSENFNLDISAAGGLGGSGGRGGPGGEGGAGGPRGYIRYPWAIDGDAPQAYTISGCVASDGRRGPSGNSGIHGRNGANGQALPYLLKLVDREE